MTSPEASNAFDLVKAVVENPELIQRPEGGRPFELVSEFQPAGDQPQAIAELIDGLLRGERDQVLLGVTGSGKTFTMAHVIAAPAAPGADPGAQQDPGGPALRRDEELLPEQRGRVFRLATTTTTSPRPMSRAPTPTSRRPRRINEQIDRMRHSATRALFERRRRRHRRLGLLHLRHRLARDLCADDADPARGPAGRARSGCCARLVELQYRRNDLDFTRGTFRVARRHDRDLPGPSRGPRLAAVDVRRRDRGDRRVRPADRREARQARAGPALPQQPLRDAQADAAAGGQAASRTSSRSGSRSSTREGKLLEAQRLEQRTIADLEMIDGDRLLRRDRELLALSDRPAARASRRRRCSSTCRENALLFVDESHVAGAAARRHVQGRLASANRTLAEFGFRLPSCIDNRPLKFEEWDADAAADDLRLGHARPLGAGAHRRRLRRAGDPPDRPDRPALHRPPGRAPGRRPDGRVPRGCRARASACWSPR